MLDSAATPQPAPSEGVTPVYRMVIADILSRVDAGRQKYGTPLQTHNGRSARWDLYQELIDACLYERQYIEEADDEVQFLRQWLKDLLGTDDEHISLCFANWLRQRKAILSASE
jgi:hypothetical protein